MEKSQKDRVVLHWRSGAKDTLKLAKDVLAKGHYDHALFCGHLALEKLLKSMVVEQSDSHAPRTHDLLYLAGLAKIDLDVARQKFLTEVNSFNIAGRYPEEQLEFYKRATKSMAKQWLNDISNFFLWLSKQREK